MKYGFDCSHHQGIIDFSEVVKNDPKMEFCFIKATEGVGYVDAGLTYSASEAKKYGLKVGYYHYASLNTHNVVQDAKDEANAFVNAINKCVAPDLPLVLDIEENKAGISKDEVKLWITTFFDQLTQRGFKDHLIYSYTSFLNDNLPKDHGLGNIPLWIAAYVSKAQPVLPKGWTEYSIWQYTAKGRIRGCKTDTDLNKTLK